MSLEVHFKGGPRAGEVLKFDDQVERISFGRNPDLCQVIFPPEQTRVGREHCAVRRQVGKYHLVLNNSDVVLLNGQRALDGQELPDRADLQLGKGGPEIVLVTTAAGELPPTEGREPAPGAATRLVATERSARRAKLLGALALLLLLIAAPLGFLGLRSSRAMQGVFEQVRPSVYLVIVKSKDGSLFTSATAWVIDREQGILATNAHVASEFQTLKPGQTLIARSVGAQPSDYEISEVRIHPGYRDSTNLWNEYGPAIHVDPETTVRIDAAGPACDVALMFLKDHEGLGPALKLAPPEELKKLNAGYPIGYVGYPMEGLALGGVNANAPSPSSQAGEVGQRTTYFGVADAPDEQRLLVQHNLSLAGGASGSPVLNTKGQVVAVLSGENAIGALASGVRLTSSANINFAQRSDLVQELLDNTATSSQAKRTDQWNRDIAQHYGRLSDLRKTADLQKAINLTVDSWKSDLENYQRSEATVGAPTSYKLTLTEPIFSTIPSSEEQTLDLSEAGPWLVVAVGPAAFDLKVVEILANGQSLDVPGATTDLQGTGADVQCRYVRLSLAGKTGAKAIVNSASAQDVQLQVFRATTRQPTVEERFDTQAQQWLHSIQQMVSPDAKLVLEADQPHTVSETDPSNTPVEHVDLGNRPPGEYLLMIVPADGDALDLAAERLPPGGDIVYLASDGYPRVWAIAPFTLHEAADLRAFIVGRTAGSKFQLRLYRADYPGSSEPRVVPPS